MRPTISVPLLVLSLAGLTGCTFDAVNITSESPDKGQDSRPSHSPQAVVEVYADPGSPERAEIESGSVPALAKDLTRTGLFKSVVIGAGHKDAALSFIVRVAEGVSRCGTPHALSSATLGLWHDSTGYSHTYDFTIRSRKGESLEIKKEYEGEILSGLLALPLRASHAWSAPSEDAGAAAVVVDALRQDLEREPLVASLADSAARRPSR